ncbi:hypothetical protein [Acidiplasma cupricumulans]|uniref:hypothetical protein n=1 Tax=Acidiplasma cupricumulans TaxID=312540 RepID=UPI000782B3FC|nr:hypothetical protein [Acidiplasma cupricumulans]
MKEAIRVQNPDGSFKIVFRENNNRPSNNIKQETKETKDNSDNKNMKKEERRSRIQDILIH